MKRPLCAVTVTLALLGSAGLAAAQKADTAHADLMSSQQQMNSQGLASSPSQSAPGGTQPQVGSKLPDSMNAQALPNQALPNNVTDQVPELKSLLIVKLPDRIVLISPDTKLVTEVVREPTTSGSSSENTVLRSSCGTGTAPPCK